MKRQVTTFKQPGFNSLILKIASTHRSFADEAETIDAAYLKVWRAAENLLRTCTYYGDEWSVTFDVNWGVITKKETHACETDKKFYELLKAGKNLDEMLRAFQDGPTKLRCDVKIEGPLKNRNKAPRVEYMVECFLCDIFLMLNLAAPGICSFHNVGIQFKERENYQSQLSISGVEFENALVDGVRNKWPAVKFVPLKCVHKWFTSLRSDFSQIPKNRMEKVLFSLLHIAEMDRSSPTTIIWLFYALETLFDTKAGENFRSLTERIQLLLRPHEKQSKFLRNRLREMYVVRSSFVHGGLQVSHPLHNERLDERVDEEHLRLMNLTDFGFALLLSSIQEVISNGWKEPVFQEQLSGESLFDAENTEPGRVGA